MTASKAVITSGMIEASGTQKAKKQKVLVSFYG